jgi:hypothetical protein
MSGEMTSSQRRVVLVAVDASENAISAFRCKHFVERFFCFQIDLFMQNDESN